MEQHDFLEQFRWIDSTGWQAIAVGHPTRLQFVGAGEPYPEMPSEQDVYFGPALRKNQGAEKEDVLGSRVLWVDVDNEQYPQCTLPPSMVVHSGHGWHLYWVLDRPLLDVDRTELYNKALSRDIPTADKACWNCNRVLRVPGTTNSKDPRRPVRLHRNNPISYEAQDFETLVQLDAKTRHKIRTGDRRGYRSRSERDWAVVTDLVRSGATDRLIHLLFDMCPVGDKHRDDETPESYLDHTITRARAHGEDSAKSGFAKQEDGYYDIGRRGGRRLSTFVIHPRLLLDGTAYGATDAIMGDIEAFGHQWGGVTFTRAAFTSVAKFDREAPVAAWQWLGRDDDIRKLLPFMIAELHEIGMPRVVATPVLGLHQINGGWFFVSDKQTLGADSIWTQFDGPIAALPTGRERPSLRFGDAKFDPAELASIIASLNSPDVIWPMIGWYTASIVKPWLELQGYRFPILNVCGTKGSGKTTLIQRVFLPLLGQLDPKTYDAGTTRFVKLALLGGTNAIPIAFSEFRYSSVLEFIRYILLSYDTGHDPRGRGDQTTVDYPLSAPFSVDGEDIISDPAAQERMVVAQLSPATIEEGGESYAAFRRWSGVAACKDGFARHLVQYVLGSIGSDNAQLLLDGARADSYSFFPQRLPDRIRNNHVVTYFGAKLFCAACGSPAPGFDVLTKSINAVYNVTAGRTRVAVDDFVEALANDVAGFGDRFKWDISDAGATLWFQLSGAHSWWLADLRRRGKVGLERDAIRIQLSESTYAINGGSSMVVAGTIMYGISLPLAQGAGLDVPDHIGRFAS